MNQKSKIVGLALLCLALGSQALTLGRIRGAVLIGKPLDVAVQVQLGSGEDASTQCFEADVFHADTRQEASRVRVLVDAAGPAQTANVRILSSALVDEPVVTVYLRTGCSQKSTRRYVLLADMPSEVAAPLPSLLGAPLAALSAPVVQRSVPLAVALPRPSVRAASPIIRPQQTTPKESPKSVMAGATRAATRSPGRPHLKLDLLELMEEREPTLNFATELLTAPTGNPQVRSEAAALWLALSASPEETLRQSTRVRALESDINALKSLTAKNQLGLTDLGARLHKAESERFPAGVVYGLGALLLLSLAALAFLWSRRQRAQANDGEWWNGSTSGPASATGATEPRPAPELEPLRQAQAPAPGLKMPSSPAVAAPWKDSGTGSAIDVSMVEVSHSIFDELMRADAAAHKAPPRPTAALAPQEHHLNALTLLGYQQQVEFLLSMGKHEQAVDLLKQQLHDGGSPNPFLYLDLLGLFHSLGMKSDFQHCREDFGSLFTGRVPEFAAFRDEGRSLEAYLDVLSRVTRLWLTPQVLEFLEACIFQDPFEGKQESFDLAAFRELLLLHAVAQRLAFAPVAQSDEPDPLSLNEAQRPHILDLDLSESELGPLAFDPAAMMDIDIPLPIPHEQALGVPKAHLTLPPARK